jgi:hypothetical protein
VGNGVPPYDHRSREKHRAHDCPGPRRTALLHARNIDGEASNVPADAVDVMQTKNRLAGRVVDRDSVPRTAN